LLLIQTVLGIWPTLWPIATIACCLDTRNKIRKPIVLLYRARLTLKKVKDRRIFRGTIGDEVKELVSLMHQENKRIFRQLLLAGFASQNALESSVGQRIVL
jgi:hypothetical protein